MVLIYWGIGQRTISDANRGPAILKSLAALPLRGVAKHLCYDHITFRPVFTILARAFHPFHAIRFLAHYGSSMECMYNLMTVGITRDAMPIQDDGTNIELAYHQSFLESLQAKEEQEQEERQINMIVQGSEGVNDIDNQPFLSMLDDDEILQQLLQYDEDNDDPIDETQQQSQQQRTSIGDPLPMNCSSTTTSNPLSSELIARLLRSSITDPTSSSSTTDDPIPISQSSQLEKLPPKLLSKLLRASISMRSSSENAHPNATTMTSATGQQRSPQQQQQYQQNIMVIVPGPLDVVMGRGRHNKNKPGNRKVQQAVEERYEEYENADKFQKTVLTECIVNALVADGSRFLVRQGDKKNGVWVEVTPEKAREKISHDFRNLRTEKKKTNAVSGGKAKEDTAVKRRRSSHGLQEGIKRLFGM
jgi:hypothetical protein